MMKVGSCVSINVFSRMIASLVWIEMFGGKPVKKVLIVDDAAFVRFAMKNMLEKNGYEVVGEAPDGSSAILQYKKLRPDFVTMDITMPGMNGIETLKEIKKFDPNAVIVMVSAMGHENFVKEAVLNGAVYFLVKPIKEENLVEVLSKIIEP